MKKSLLIVPGFQTNSNGPMLGLRSFAEVIQSIYGFDPYYSTDWNKLSGQFFQDLHGDFTMLIAHSYGCAAAKRELDIWNGVIDLAIFLDPVPRFLWGQFRWTGWTLPTNIKRAVCLYQKNFPPTGVPFTTSKNYESYSDYNVSNWDNNLYHCDIPNSKTVQALIIKELEKCLPV